LNSKFEAEKQEKKRENIPVGPNLIGLVRKHSQAGSTKSGR
jgi:hypothetical protein